MLKMSQAQLDDLFTQSPAGGIPSGEAKGTAIVAPGTTYSQNIADFVSHFAWQGKVFDPAKGALRNRILPFGLNAIIAKVYKDRVGWITKNASSWIIRTLRYWPIGFVMKSAKLAPGIYLGIGLLG